MLFRSLTRHVRQLPTTRSLRYASSTAGPTKSAMELMAQGVTELSSGNTKTALEHFKQAELLQPATADIHYNRGVAEYSLGNIDQALNSWIRATQLDPNQADTHVNIGNVYFMNKKDNQQAISHMRRAAELAPRDAEILFNLACIHEATDDLAAAIRCYDRAAEEGLEKAKTHMRNAMAKQMNKVNKK